MPRSFTKRVIEGIGPDTVRLYVILLYSARQELWVHWLVSAIGVWHLRSRLPLSHCCDLALMLPRANLVGSHRASPSCHSPAQAEKRPIPLGLPNPYGFQPPTASNRLCTLSASSGPCAIPTMIWGYLIRTSKPLETFMISYKFYLKVLRYFCVRR